MIAHSAEYVEAFASGNLVNRVLLEVIEQDQVIASSALADDGVTIVEGAVTKDATASIRGRWNVSFVDERAIWVPAEADELFSNASGHEVRLWKGLLLPDGTEELKPLIVGAIEASVVNDSTAGLRIEVSGFDRSQQVRDNAWLGAYVVRPGQSPVTAIRAIVTDRRPGTRFTGLSPDEVAFTTPRLLYEEQADPWAAAETVASGAGLEVLWEPLGECLIRRVPDPMIEPVVWVYEEGPDATFTALATSSAAERPPNGVIAVGESTYGITPARAVAWDTNPSSPTYSGYDPATGAFADVPYRRKVKALPPNPSIGMKAQAQAAADAELRKTLGLSRSIDIELVPNPAHELGDVVQIIRARSRVDQAFVLERMPMPLGATQTTRVTTRARLAA